MANPVCFRAVRVMALKGYQALQAVVVDKDWRRKVMTVGKSGSAVDQSVTCCRGEQLEAETRAKTTGVQMISRPAKRLRDTNGRLRGHSKQNLS